LLHIQVEQERKEPWTLNVLSSTFKVQGPSRGDVVLFLVNCK
jgi:hypothetical protein